MSVARPIGGAERDEKGASGEASLRTVDVSSTVSRLYRLPCATYAGAAGLH
jgi:hypothetical protein